jgi:hypothetical protein
MKIIRYTDKENAIHYAMQHADGRAERLEGCIYENPKPSGELADVAKLLAPVEPRRFFA